MKKRLISAVIAAAMALTALTPVLAAGDEAAVTYTSNVTGKTGVTNIGANGVGLIEVTGGTAQKSDVKLFRGETEITDFEITATVDGFTVDPMYFSTMDKTANTLNIYPTEETDCKIQIGEQEINFSCGVILPVAHKDGYNIANVALGVVPTLADGVEENKHDRGTKEVVTDGTIYGAAWDSLFSPRGSEKKQHSPYFSLDLGKEYEIAGLAMSGSEKSWGDNTFIEILCDNSATTSSWAENDATMKIGWGEDLGNNQGKEQIGIGKKQDGSVVKNEVLTNFSITGKTSRYVHVGRTMKKTGVDISELMVFAYVSDGSALSATSNVDGKTVTNVGDNATHMIKVNCGRAVSKSDIKIYVGETEITDFEIVGTQTGFKIDPMYFSTMDKTASTLNIYPMDRTDCKIVIDADYGKGEINFKSELILPIAHKDGYNIANVALGVVPTLKTTTISFTDSSTTLYLIENPETRGTKEVVTDGTIYGAAWNSIFSPRWSKDGTKDGGYDKARANQVMFTLDLGAEYDIAGVALSGSEKSTGANRFYAAQCDNSADTDIMDDKVLNTGFAGANNEIQVSVGMDQNKTVIKNEILSNFSITDKTSRYVHVGKSIASTELDMSELMVFAYVESDDADSVKAELAAVTDFTANNAAVLRTLHEKIAEYEEDGISFETAENWDKFSEIRPNLYKVNTVTLTAEDDKAYIDVTFDGDADISYLNNVKYFVGTTETDPIKKENTSETTDKCRSLRLTVSNLDKTSDNVRVTVKEGWVGQTTKELALPNAIALDNFKADAKKVTLTAKNNYYTDAVAGDVIVALKNADGSLAAVKTYPVNLVKGAAATDVSVSFDVDVEDYTQEVYFWDGYTDIKPYTKKTEHNKTYGIDNVNDTAKDITVALIGGSITENGNITDPFLKTWSDSREGKIRYIDGKDKKYGINAGIGGTESDYGSLRLHDDVLAYKPDVVVVEFCLNDGSTASDTDGVSFATKNIENIIRACHEAEHEPAVMFLIVPDRRCNTSTDAQNNVTVGKYWIDDGFEKNYKAVLEYYGITALNTQTLVKSAIAQAEYADDADKIEQAKTDNSLTYASNEWDKYIPSNNVHPTKDQGANIAALMWTEFGGNIGTYLKTVNVPTAKYTNGNSNYKVIGDVKNGKRVASTIASYDESWTEMQPGGLVTEGYGVPTNMTYKKYLVTSKAGAKYSFEFTGTKLMLTTIVNTVGREADYVVYGADGSVEASGTINNKANSTGYENVMNNSVTNKHFALLNLADGSHKIEITVKDGTTGTYFGIGDILIDGK